MATNITKKALSWALRELMEEYPFEKISISQICDKCGITRKSFYYHFRDKYDLVNWSFDTDFLALVRGQDFDTWAFLNQLCGYLYANRSFYRKALNIQGQNAFSDHFQEMLAPIVQQQLAVLLNRQDVHPMCIDFLTDACVCAVKRWLLDKDCMPPEQFCALLQSLVQSVSEGLYLESGGTA